MERSEAVKLGLSKYNTGRPCRHGHVVDRYTQSGACSACVKNLTTVFAGRSAELRAEIARTTVRIYLYSQESGFTNVKKMVDDLVSNRCPNLPPDEVNPIPFRSKKKVGRLTYRIAVRVPISDVDIAYSMGKLMLEPEHVEIPRPRSADETFRRMQLRRKDRQD